jgi:hypothetical protein
LYVDQIDPGSLLPGLPTASLEKRGYGLYVC